MIQAPPDGHLLDGTLSMSEPLQAYSQSGVGSARWRAPELLHPEAWGMSNALPTFASDVFAFGMVIYEVRRTLADTLAWLLT